MSVHPYRTTVTEAEFLALPETLDRIELIDGEVVMPPAPNRYHQRLVVRILVELDAWARAHPPHEALPSPLDVRFGPGRIVQPDVAVFSESVGRGFGPITTVPKLVVEVMASNRAYDRITKRHIYADAGVPEYWIVDAEEEAVEVVRGLGTVAVHRERLDSTLLEGFSLDVKALFAA